MRSLPAGLQASLTSGVTTLCHCWLLAPIGGEPLGFTDHDRDLSFDGVAYEAMAGMTASSINATGALNIDTTDISGALQSDYLNEADLAGGLYDNAALTLFLVDWSDVANRDIIFAGSIGEVSRGPNHFTTEMRGLSHAPNQPTGRLYQRSCDAELGDGRCGVNLAAPVVSGAGVVTAVDSNANFAASGLDSYGNGWFERGRLTWTSGANEGGVMEIKFHVNNSAQVSLTTWESMPFDVAIGDTFGISAGCDKSTATCIAKFANIANFRGFPFLPGNDILTAYPSRSGGADGSSRFEPKSVIGPKSA